MDMPTTAAWWWIAAGIAVIAEMASGTFYLLMIALGLVAGALASHLGASVSIAVVSAAVVGGGATVALHWRRLREPKSLDASENRDVNLDIGESVVVREWSADGTTRVDYRGSTWGARLAAGAAPRSGAHRVKAVQGNWLVLEPLAAQSIAA